MRWLSDNVLNHLCQAADWPDLGGTRYELIDRLGQGGMGVVYLARDQVLDRPVALKVLRTLQADPQVRTRLANEARIIARLEHPGIVPVHDAGELPDGRVYYAMKLVRGRRLDEAPGLDAPLGDRLRVFEKICEAVAFAHAHGVIHRDLKPQNVMVGAFGEVLVMDWGVAKVLAVDAEATPLPEHASGDEPLPGSGTAHGTILGTPGYMAPEQARGDVAGTGPRTDVYALGGILSFLLSGQAPAEENGPPAVVLPGRRSSPRALRAIILKARAADPAARYADVAALAADIGRYLAGLRVAAHPEGLLGTAGRLLFKYRTAVLLVLAYLTMRVLLLIWAGK